MIYSKKVIRKMNKYIKDKSEKNIKKAISYNSEL